MQGAYLSELSERSSLLMGEVSEAVIMAAEAITSDDRELAGQAAERLERASGHALELADTCRSLESRP